MSEPVYEPWRRWEFCVETVLQRTGQESSISEERLEIIEKQAHRENNAVLIEVCREVRRLQARVATLAESERKRRDQSGGTGLPGESVGGY